LAQIVYSFPQVKEQRLRLAASKARLNLLAFAALLFLGGGQAQAGLILVEPAFPSVDIPLVEPSSAKQFDLFLGQSSDFTIGANDIYMPTVTLSACVAELDENASFARRFPFSSETYLPFVFRVMTTNRSPAPGGPSTHSNSQEGSASRGPAHAQIGRGRYLRAISAGQPCRPFVVGLFRPPRSAG
jgi:hypothetical protein